MYTFLVKIMNSTKDSRYITLNCAQTAYSTYRHTLLSAAQADAYVQTDVVALRLSVLVWPLAHPVEPADALHSSADTSMQLKTKPLSLIHI